MSREGDRKMREMPAGWVTGLCTAGSDEAAVQKECDEIWALGGSISTFWAAWSQWGGLGGRGEVMVPRGPGMRK